MITRHVSAFLTQSEKRILLLGPRQVGKSTLIRSLHPDVELNLADEDVFFQCSSDAGFLRRRLEGLKGKKRATIFIDEVQRLPRLLNTVQALLDEQPSRWRFFLTGSSARKLKRGRANLLPGRIHTYHLGPMTLSEYSVQKLTDWLAYGALPGVLFEKDERAKKKTLRSYASVYLREEIQAEALTRNIEGFARFIRQSAEWSGRTLDISKLAMAAGVPRLSAMRWFEILEDTLLARRIDSFAKSLTRRLVQHPRYYYFDVGVLNGLLGSFDVSEDRKGNLFEHWFLQQLCDTASARDIDLRVSTYRTEAGAEVDFIVETEHQTFAVEVKAATHGRSINFNGLNSFAQYFGKKHRALIAYAGKHSLQEGKVQILPVQQTIEAILGG